MAYAAYFSFYLCVLYSTSIKRSLQMGRKYTQQLHSCAIAFNYFAPIMLLFALLFHVLTKQMVSNFLCGQRNDVGSWYN